MLLGADVYYYLLREGVRHDQVNKVVVQETIFGWIVTGQMTTVPAVTALSVNVQLDSLLQRFWEQEETQPHIIMSPDDALCESIYDRSMVRDEDGRYIVELPFR